MRDVGRILPLLMRIGHAWMRHPDLRLGQLVTNVMHADVPVRAGSPPLFYIEDEELVQSIEQYCQSFNS